MALYNLADVQRAIPASSLAKGQHYLDQGHVLAVDVKQAGRAISGTVRGNSPWPYKVVVRIAEGRWGMQISGDCTCPVGHNCKHVAAVALQVLAAEPAASDEALPDTKVTAWLERLEHAAGPTPRTNDAHDVSDYIVYLLSPRTFTAAPPAIEVSTVIARRLKSGGWGKPRNARINRHSTERYLRAEDERLLTWLEPLKSASALRPLLSGREGARLLQELIATGRCHWRDTTSAPLALGDARYARLEWETTREGLQRLRCTDVEGVDFVLPFEPPWYLDRGRGECGPLHTGLPDNVAMLLLQAPPLAPEDVARAQQTLALLPAHAPQPRTLQSPREQHVKPTPCLSLLQAEIPVVPGTHRRGMPRTSPAVLPLMRLSFDYDGMQVQYGDREPALTRVDGEYLVRIARDVKTEMRARNALAQWHAVPLASYRDLAPPPEHAHDFTISVLREDISQDVIDFTLHGLPKLRRDGWRIDVAEDWPFRVVEEVGDWYGEIEESGNDWFTLELGVTIEGGEINLLPLLVDMLAQNPDIGAIAHLPADQAPQSIYARLPDGRLLPIPFERVRNILGTLVELYDTSLVEGRLRLPKLHVAQLQDLRNIQWEGSARLRELAARLRDFNGIEPVAPPRGLRAELRHYQCQGLNWLQFLRTYELAGILADDMGLGKTVQALAHVLTEKENDRLDRPCLVVAPTSLMTNWRLEAQRFTPDLEVLVLHGTARKQDYTRLPHVDVILTTYPLLPRDYKVLAAQDYHMLILDEAQVIKNPKAKAAQVLRQLRARHRLCLTGTPMENHLGELWSLFDFMLPGLLGDDRRFRRLFRTPIEKHGDAERSQSLRRRIAPFMLRRAKHDVVTELPPKTEIVRSVELSGTQRDLYESIRLAMHEKVRHEISKKGMARSHIVILDALLKLRQVCCDPRLVKLDSARKAQHSAKLELLMDMLPELVEEGRRILLFSQFTSMLALIEAELARANVEYVQLTGHTRDRATPIAQFQDGKVPLFLISLKAGGTGLNLTAADTVIHYDPWWNPAVEHQATDRAHRIGQDKPVFVYKLITVGTVEEKILTLQARKQELADSLFDPSAKTGPKLAAQDLDALFEPLA